MLTVKNWIICFGYNVLFINAIDLKCKQIINKNSLRLIFYYIFKSVELLYYHRCNTHYYYLKLLLFKKYLW